MMVFNTGVWNQLLHWNSKYFISWAIFKTPTHYFLIILSKKLNFLTEFLKEVKWLNIFENSGFGRISPALFFYLLFCSELCWKYFSYNLFWTWFPILNLFSDLPHLLPTQFHDFSLPLFRTQALKPKKTIIFNKMNYKKQNQSKQRSTMPCTHERERENKSNEKHKIRNNTVQDKDQ